MDSIIKNLIEEYKHKTEDEIKTDALVQIAIASMRAGQLYQDKANETLLGMLVIYVKLAIEADGKFVEKEKELLSLVAKPFEDVVEYSNFMALCSGGMSASEYEILAKTSELDTVLGDAFARIMMCFMAVDGDICNAEVNTFKGLFMSFAEKMASYELLGGSDLYRALVE